MGERRNGTPAGNLALLRVEVKKGDSEVPELRSIDADLSDSDMHPKKVTVLKVTGVELVTLFYF